MRWLGWAGLNVIVAMLVWAVPAFSQTGGVIQRASPVIYLHPDVTTFTVHTAALEFGTRPAPPAPSAARSARIFVHASNTAGKDLLCVQFRTGVPQCFGKEP